MATKEPSVSRPSDSEERRVPAMQEIYDNVWFLFLLSLFVILVFYLIWGLIDLVNLPTLP